MMKSFSGVKIIVNQPNRLTQVKEHSLEKQIPMKQSLSV